MQQDIAVSQQQRQENYSDGALCNQASQNEQVFAAYHQHSEGQQSTAKKPHCQLQQAQQEHKPDSNRARLDETPIKKASTSTRIELSAQLQQVLPNQQQSKASPMQHQQRQASSKHGAHVIVGGSGVEAMNFIQRACNNSRSQVQRSQQSEQLQRTSSLTDTATPNKVMSRDSSAQLDKDKKVSSNNSKRVKKSQALIQSKIASQSSSLSSSVQQMPVSKQHVNISAEIEQANHQNATSNTALKSRETISKSLSKQKKIVQLQSERVSLEPGSGLKLNAQSNLGSSNLKSALMVISSTNMHRDPLTQPNSTMQIAGKSDLQRNEIRRSTLESGDGPSNLDQKIQEAHRSTITDITTGNKTALASPIKPSHRLQAMATSATITEQSPLRNRGMSRAAERKGQNDLPDKQSQTSIKANLKPFIVQKSAQNNKQKADKNLTQAHQQASNAIAEQEALIQGQNIGAASGMPQNQRQLKQIRNSFNNFFVTSKQPQSDNKIKFRMSQAEQRNELKNYLELASLAGDSSLNDQMRASSLLYKRANPMLSHEHSEDVRIMTNGFEAARRESNISQLQALNQANAQLMPTLQSSNGFRNHHNRTSLGQPQRSLKQHDQVNLAAGFQGVENVTIAASALKPKPDKPYQSETYRVIKEGGGGGGGAQGQPSIHSQADKNSSSKSHQHPKFLVNRQSPVSLSLASRMQYNDSGAQSTLTGAATSSSIVLAGDSLQHNGGASSNYQQQQKMSNKFISGKLGLMYASAKGQLQQPVRARTNLDKYPDQATMALKAVASDQQNFFVPSSSSVATIQMPTADDQPSFKVPKINDLRSGETSLQQPIETPSKNGGSMSSRKTSSYFIKNTLNTQQKQQKSTQGQQLLIN